MKIVHLCLASFYPDNYAYQENMLPKFHKKLGFDVEVIASTQSFDEHGKTCYLDKVGSYQNEYDIKVTRLAYKSGNKIWKKLKRYTGTFNAIEKATPDIIFIHGCQFLDIDQVVKYLKKHPDVKVFVDNHADFSNSARGWVSKNILHKIIWRHSAHKIEPYTTKFYGVLPARVDFLKNIYKLPAEKCELLVMGADDELVEKAKTMNSHNTIREKHTIGEDDLLIVTGGKINRSRPEVLNLIETVISLDNPKIKLLVFGNVSEEYKERFDHLCKNDKVIFVGWLKSADTYGYFEAADLVVFPGLHSVMWEQAVAQGKAVVFRDIDGFHHVDVGGNALFVKDVSVEGLRKALSELIDDEDKIKKMTSVAEEKGMKVFSYADIARRSIQC